MVRVPSGSDSPDTPPATRRLLCLSGGGFRGLFSAIVLEHMEARLKLAGLGALRDQFDLIAGTSIGGLLACGLAAGVPARHLRETLEEHGAACSRRSLWKAAAGSP
jgi:patatin-like phospholipase/acyl hydrolase